MLRSSLNYWYKPKISLPAALLLPLAWIFGLIVRVRRWCYRSNILSSYKAPVPVIVVGNLTVGGTGKTPCVIALAGYLKSQGFHPGLVSRGVGGKKHRLPCLVTHDSTANDVGDEAILLSRETNCPMVVCVHRSDAVRTLLKYYPECNIVLSDDGLQHYRMQRDIEVIVVDGERQFGNQMMLPAGPLREPLSRLNMADFVVVNNGHLDGAYNMKLQPKKWVCMANQATRPLDCWSAVSVHAVAGVGNPGRFFQTLHGWCGEVSEHQYPDHYQYQSGELDYPDSMPVLMTAKDAVKYEEFANERHWYLDVDVLVEADMLERILQKIS